MVLPGWNVSEPLQVAAKFCNFVREYRGAPNRIKKFASAVNDFCLALKTLESFLQNATEIPPENLKTLKDFSEGSLRQCAEACQRFVDGFFTRVNVSLRDEVGAGNRLNWIWKEKEADELKLDMNSQVGLINLHLQLARMNHRTSATPAITPASTPARNDPLTPSVLLGLDNAAPPPFPESKIKTWPPVAATLDNPKAFNSAYHPQAKHDSFSITPISEASTSPESPWSHLVDHLPVEILQRRGPESTLSSSFSTTSMEDLDGVAISYTSRDSSKPLPVQKLEFLKDTSGTLLYIVATPPARYKAKIFQKISLSSQVVPHTEHPRAYKSPKALQIKFLEPHQVTSQRWSRTNSNSATRSVETSSNRDLSDHSKNGTPDTLSSAASYISSTCIGSPFLSAAVCSFVDETKYPKYHFESANDFKNFQEIVVGKELLLNAPIDLIESRQLNPFKIQEEAEKQYLQLWTDGRSQTIMYHANLLDSTPQYLQHDIERFKPNDPKSTSTTLRLNVKQPGIHSSTFKRQGSILSKFSGPTISSYKLSRKSIEIDETTSGSEMSEGVNSRVYLSITFSEEKDKTAFLEKAKFRGIASAEAIPPFAFQQPSF